MSRYDILPKCQFFQRLTLLGKKRLPAGYQPGLTLNKIARDISPYECEWQTPGALVIRLPDETVLPHESVKSQGLIIDVTERVKTLFMAFIVYSRFSVAGFCDKNVNARIDVKTTGYVRNKKVRFISRQSDGHSVAAWFDEYPIIRQTLEELDFNHCYIEIKEGNWCCVIEPYTASEMVSRIPATRRYLRLSQQQRHRLLSALQLISQLMDSHKIAQ